MSRWKAAGLHLLLSILVITGIGSLVLWLWYPLALVHVAGIDRLIGLIALVDITVGPLLTLIVYRQGKPGLTFDLAAIAIIQLVLLVYGLHALSLKRPVYLVGVVDRFELVTANQIADDDLAAARPPYDRLPWTGATLVGAPLPDDTALRSQILSDALEGRDIHVRPAFYAAFDRIAPTLASYALPYAEFESTLGGGDKDAARRALGNRTPDRTAVLPLSTSHGAATMLVDSETCEPLAPVAIDYWNVVRQN